jgi:eukaryotic-like serine/threonine-protein kinase
MSVVGTRVGRYELLRLLAAGGMGEVYLARHRPALGDQHQLVAVKMMLRGLSSNPQFVRMFLEEARIVGGIDHKNIVQIREIAEHDGQYFMAMEYIPGQNLRELLGDPSIHDRPLFEPRLGAELFAEIAGALVAAHKLALVHRDISPNNVMISDHGSPKLIDFGVARAMGAVSLTTPGTLKGKFGYMAPEYVRNQPYDDRIDVFSLGVVMWETFARRRLFRGANEAAQLHQLLDGEIPRLDTVVAGFPRDLATVVEAALERDPQRRISSAVILASALRELAGTLAPGSDPSVRQWLARRIPERIANRRQNDERLRGMAADAVAADIEPLGHEFEFDPAGVPETYNFRASGGAQVSAQTSRPSRRDKTTSSVGQSSGQQLSAPSSQNKPRHRWLWLGAAVAVIGGLAGAAVAIQRESADAPGPALALAPDPRAPAIAPVPVALPPAPVAAARVAPAEPVAAEPVAAEPVAAEPVAAEPVAAEPVAAERLATPPAHPRRPAATATLPAPHAPATRASIRTASRPAPGPRSNPEPPTAEPAPREVAHPAPPAPVNDAVPTPPAVEPPVPAPSSLPTSAPVAALPPPRPPATPRPPPTPRVTGTGTGAGDIAAGARVIQSCNGCHIERGARRVSSRAYARAQWDRFFATGQHDRYVPIGDRVTASQLIAAKAYMTANAADAPENQGAGVRE